MKCEEINSWAVSFNVAVLQQSLDMLDLVALAEYPHDFGDVIGPHLRHVIEHYELLLNCGINEVMHQWRFDSQASVRSAEVLVDYDARIRDLQLQKSATLARKRIAEIQRRLESLGEEFGSRCSFADVEVKIAQWIGIEGQQKIVAPSNWLRELMFLASHAIHHFAVLKEHLQGCGIVLPADFGKASSTVRHEREDRQAGRSAPHAPSHSGAMMENMVRN